MNTSKSLVNTAIARLITDRDTGAIDDYFATDFVQHSTRIEAGPEGLQSFVRNLPESSSFEPARTLAQDDLVVTHGVYRLARSRNHRLGYGLCDCGDVVGQARRAGRRGLWTDSKTALLGQCHLYPNKVPLRVL